MGIYVNGQKIAGAYVNGQKVNAFVNGSKVLSAEEDVPIYDPSLFTKLQNYALQLPETTTYQQFIYPFSQPVIGLCECATLLPNGNVGFCRSDNFFEYDVNNHTISSGIWLFNLAYPTIPPPEQYWKVQFIRVIDKSTLVFGIRILIEDFFSGEESISYGLVALDFVSKKLLWKKLNIAAMPDIYTAYGLVGFTTSSSSGFSQDTLFQWIFDLNTLTLTRTQIDISGWGINEFEGLNLSRIVLGSNGRYYLSLQLSNSGNTVMPILSFSVNDAGSTIIQGVPLGKNLMGMEHSNLFLCLLSNRLLIRGAGTFPYAGSNKWVNYTGSSLQVTQSNSDYLSVGFNLKSTLNDSIIETVTSTASPMVRTRSKTILSNSTVVAQESIMNGTSSGKFCALPDNSIIGLSTSTNSSYIFHWKDMNAPAVPCDTWACCSHYLQGS